MVTETAMELWMPGVPSLTSSSPSDEDIVILMGESLIRQAGHVDHSTDNWCTQLFTEWHAWERKRLLGRTPERWRLQIRRVEIEVQCLLTERLGIVCSVCGFISVTSRAPTGSPSDLDLQIVQIPDPLGFPFLFRFILSFKNFFWLLLS